MIEVCWPLGTVRETVATTIFPRVAPGSCGSKVTLPEMALAVPAIFSMGASSLNSILLPFLGSLQSKVSGAATAGSASADNIKQAIHLFLIILSYSVLMHLTMFMFQTFYFR